MSIQTLTAIILQSYETGNSSDVVRIFSPEVGRLSVMCRGLRSPKSRAAGIIQPLATVELTVSLREGADIATLREASPIRSRAELHDDLERLALGFLLAEAASESCDVAQESRRVFGVLERGLDHLGPESLQPAATAAAHALARILTLAGYEPQFGEELLRPWPVGAPKPAVFVLNLEEALLVAPERQPTEPPQWPAFARDGERAVALPPEAVRALYQNLQTEEERLHRLPRLDGAHACQLVEALVRLAQWHLGHPLRSASFWRQIVG
jgi:DNA repair protein RecO (recombination protein O)